MQLPFGVDAFFAVFRAYNTGVWPAQLVLTALALAALAAAWRPSVPRARFVAAVLAALWAWIAIAYHAAFFSRINPAAWLFAGVSLLGAAAFAWFGVVRGAVQFRIGADPRGVAGLLLIAFALVAYPLWASAAGHGWPELPTFGLPCPTTIFTIGMLCFAEGLRVRWLVAVPFAWSVVGSQAAFLLDVAPDRGLLVAGAVAAWLLLAPRPRLRGPAAT